MGFCLSCPRGRVSSTCQPLAGVEPVVREGTVGRAPGWVAHGAGETEAAPCDHVSSTCFPSLPPRSSQPQRTSLLEGSPKTCRLPGARERPTHKTAKSWEPSGWASRSGGREKCGAGGLLEEVGSRSVNKGGHFQNTVCAKGGGDLWVFVVQGGSWLQWVWAWAGGKFQPWSVEDTGQGHCTREGKDWRGTGTQRPSAEPIALPHRKPCLPLSIGDCPFRASCSCC